MSVLSSSSVSWTQMFLCAVAVATVTKLRARQSNLLFHSDIHFRQSLQKEGKVLSCFHEVRLEVKSIS